MSTVQSSSEGTAAINLAFNPIQYGLLLKHYSIMEAL